MEEINSAGNMYTWANNRESEDFVEERLDRIFGAANQFIQHPRARVLQEEKQTSDHHLLILVSDPEVSQVRKRLCFDKRWLQLREVIEVVEQGWKQEQAGTFMHRVCSKIKSSWVALLKWSKRLLTNSGKKIKELKREMEELSKQKGSRDQQTWDRVKAKLQVAYKNEEFIGAKIRGSSGYRRGIKTPNFSMRIQYIEGRLILLRDWLKKRAVSVKRKRSWKQKLLNFIAVYSQHLFPKGGKIYCKAYPYPLLVQ